MCILEQNTKNITVRLSNSRWNRLVALENAYRIAKSIVKAKRECETQPSMTVEEAKSFLSTL